jgi:hypothetical protein
MQKSRSIRVGRTRLRFRFICSQAKRSWFSESPNPDCFVLLKKEKPAIWDGDRNPSGLELASDGAERGNYPEAKPKREGRKGDLRAKARALQLNEKGVTGCPPSIEIMPHSLDQLSVVALVSGWPVDRYGLKMRSLKSMRSLSQNGWKSACA